MSIDLYKMSRVQCQEAGFTAADYCLYCLRTLKML
jgi:hypothetical protein